MNSIEDLLAKITNEHGLKPQREGGGWAVQLPQRGNLSCKLTIGPAALEWYATVNGTDGSPLWNDWMDYTGYGENSVSILIAEKSRDISWFIEQWCRASKIRIQEKRPLGFIRSKSLQAEHNDRWCEFGMCHPVHQ